MATKALLSVKEVFEFRPYREKVLVDEGTGQQVATSNSLVGTTEGRRVTQQAGVAGYLFGDGDQDGAWQPGEVGLAGWVLKIVDAGGQPQELWTMAEPDDFNDAASLNLAYAGLEMSAVGGGTTSDTVYSRVTSQASTWGRVFANHDSSLGTIGTTWNDTSRRLRIDFDQPATAVRIDAIGNGGVDYGSLEIYDEAATLLARYTTEPLTDGDVEKMQLSRPQGDIAYAVAGAHYGTELHLDHVRVGAISETTTDAAGAFWLDELEPGNYRVQVVVPPAWQATEPSSATRQVTLSEGQLPAQLSFGVAPPGWHNVVRPHDVNVDGHLVPLDALLVINDLNMFGARTLSEPTAELQPPPYLDVNGDGSVSPIDALQVITQLNDQLAGETAGASFSLDFYSLAVAAEGEPPLVEIDAEVDTANPVERAWAELCLTDALPRSRWEEVGAMENRRERATKNPPFVLDSQLEDIIADDLVGRTWLEWSSDGLHQGREPGA
ncbi:MAG: dockerin type I domain-containing protein [Pirellulaceae bacterium]|nr:dockerin type I domain-containing protein [Pirellulaceae bacterium]